MSTLTLTPPKVTAAPEWLFILADVVNEECESEQDDFGTEADKQYDRYSDK